MTQELENNYLKLTEYINKYISDKDDRKTKLLFIFNSFKDRLINYPSYYKPTASFVYPGGFIENILEHTKIALSLHNLYINHGAKLTYSDEELVFSCLVCQLGKIGTNKEALYIENAEDDWRREKLGEIYKYNSNIDYMDISDRSIFILNNLGFKLSKNEYISIKSYYSNTYNNQSSPDLLQKSSLSLIINQSYEIADRINFEKLNIDNNPFTSFLNKLK